MKATSPSPTCSRLLSGLPYAMAILALWGLLSVAPFLWAYRDQLWWLTYQHLRLLALSMPIALTIGFGIGLIIFPFPRLSNLVIGAAAAAFTIPSLALFGAMVPLLAPVGAGVGTVPAMLALVVYSQLPVIRNTVVGLKQVPASVIHSARAMGMNRWQILWRVRLPLALPVVLGGVRIAVVLSVGVGAVAAYIGAGGLGRWIFGGIRRTYPDMLLAGSLLLSLMAIVLDRLLFFLQKRWQKKWGLE